MTYIKNFLTLIWKKVTTYCALLAGLIGLLPQLVSDYWAQLEQNVPHLKMYHAVAFAGATVLTIWARVRRELKQPELLPPPKVPPAT